MNWYKKSQLQYRDIPRPDDFFEDDEDFDANAARQRVEQIFKERGVRPDSTKEFTDVAINDELPVGGLASGWTDNDDYDFPVKEFSFDVAAEAKENRTPNRTPNRGGTGMMGMRLIQEGIDRYEAEKMEWEEMGYKTMIRLWVINPRLVPILERRFGFAIEAEYGDGSAHMIRY